MELGALFNLDDVFGDDYLFYEEIFTCGTTAPVAGSILAK